MAIGLNEKIKFEKMRFTAPEQKHNTIGYEKNRNNFQIKNQNSELHGETSVAIYTLAIFFSKQMLNKTKSLEQISLPEFRNTIHQ